LDRPGRNNESFLFSGLFYRTKIAFNLRLLSDTNKFNKAIFLIESFRYAKINTTTKIARSFVRLISYI